MLIIDLNTLQAINLLDLVNKELCKFLNTENRKNIIWHNSTFHKRLASLHIIPLMNNNMLGFWYQIFLWITILRSNHHTNLSLEFLTKTYLTIDLRNDCRILRLTHLKEFSNTRQTTCNILGLGSFTRNLTNDGTRLDLFAFFYGDNRSNRQTVSGKTLGTRQLNGFTTLIFHRDTWVERSTTC